MNDMMTIAPVRKSLLVKASIARAFEVFTAGLTRWWPPNHGIGKRPIQKVLMEPRLGGRWLEIAEDGSQTVVATITLWEPPHRVVLAWQVNAAWKSDTTVSSEVDVRFVAEGADATQVALLHHKFEALGIEGGASMRKDVDGGWPVLLERFAAEASGSPLPQPPEPCDRSSAEA
jgi:uncharacterized protein YndB with AHSA1/START domain